MLMKSILTLFFGFLVLVFFDRQDIRRRPAQASPEHIVLAQRALSPDVGLVLLGVRCPEAKLACANWQALGFEGLKGDLASVEGKFLLVRARGYIEKVFIFEDGELSEKALSRALEGSDEKLLHHLKLPKTLTGKLPTQLVDTLYTKSRWRSGGRLAMKFLNYTPLSFATRTLEEITKYQESRRFYQASYLSRLIEAALIDDAFPELIDVFGREHLADLGGALRFFYRGSGDDVITEIGIDDANRAGFYEEYVRLRTETQSIQMSKLVTRANEEGLVAIPYSRDLAILYYDPQLSVDPEKYNDLLLNTRVVENAERYKSYKDATARLIPLGVFLMNDKFAPKKIVDFEAPDAAIDREKWVGLVKYAAEIGMGFILGEGKSAALSVSLFTGMLYLEKNGIIYASANLESEAHLEALLDSGLVRVETEELNREMLSFYLSQIKIDVAQEAYFNQLLTSQDPAELERGVREVILLYQSTQTGRRFAKGMSEAFKLGNKVLNGLQFERWLADPVAIEKFVAKIDARHAVRAERAQARRPSAASSDAAIILMVDGLRPDRFKEAYQKGLVPHLGQFFLENGVEFDSYAPRSLTLPSWASILTGLDQDEHGLKSNGPMSRLLGKPNEKYTDPRKDLLNYGFNRSNRAYKHLKESKSPWLPDYFNEGEVHTNYMPVNNEAFPPLTQIARAAIADYQRLLFGNLSATIGLDRASVLETIDVVKKNPGKTKLVLNWFTCVDVFSHHNNRGLEICYRELDKSFKLLMDALALDPVLKDAHVFLISDHGHTGGAESSHSHYKILDEGHYFNNTALNLTTLFAGKYRGYEAFKFSPFVFDSPYPENDLKFLKEFQIQPFRYRYRRDDEARNSKSDVLIDYSGDSLAQIYFRAPGKEWGERLSYFELTTLKDRDVIGDLLSVRVQNNVNFDARVRRALSQKNQQHPVEFVAHALKSCAKSDIEAIVGEALPVLAREPILLRNRTRVQGLILTQKSEQGLRYRYHLIQDFQQEATGKCTGRPSSSSTDEFLQQFHEREDRWWEKRELLEKFKHHSKPTALISIVGALTLSEALERSRNRQAEVPDLILFASLGFNFNSSDIFEADHGGLRRQEIKNSFFYARPGQRFDAPTKQRLFARPVFNNYLTPFVLDATGRERNSVSSERIPRFSLENDE